MTENCNHTEWIYYRTRCGIWLVGGKGANVIMNNWQRRCCTPACIFLRDNQWPQWLLWSMRSPTSLIWSLIRSRCHISFAVIELALTRHHLFLSSFRKNISHIMYNLQKSKQLQGMKDLWTGAKIAKINWFHVVNGGQLYITPTVSIQLGILWHLQNEYMTAQKGYKCFKILQVNIKVYK